MPSFEIISVLSITAIMFLLFILDRIRPDVVAIMTMTALILTGVVTPTEGISGFGDTAVITVMSMLIISTALSKTGFVYYLGKKIFNLIGNKPTLQILIIACIVTPLSGFMSSTATVAIMIPLVINLARRSKSSPQKTLIPLSYMAQMGGMLTIVGTTVNILANSIIIELGHPPLNMFALTPVAIVMIIVGVLFLSLVGQKILPNQKEKTEQDDNIFYAQIQIVTDSPFIGKTLKQIKSLPDDVAPLEIIRGDRYILKTRAVHLKQGDILNVRATGIAIFRMLKMSEIEVLTNFDPHSRRLDIESQKISRVAVVSSRSWVGKPFSETHFHDRYHARVLGVDYKHTPESGNLLHKTINNGDVMLISASDRNFERLISSGDFVMIDEIEPQYFPERIPLVLITMLGVVLLAALGILPILSAALLGVIVLLLTRTIKIDTMYHEINWQVIFILAGLIPLGIAFQKTGLMTIASDYIANMSYGLHPFLLLLVFYLATTIITEFISNAGTVVLLTPIALKVALDLGYDPVPFVAMVMFGASTSFATPIGYQTNTMVYTAGKYSFLDFIKIGVPLNIITALTVSAGAYFFWIN